jgi:hypothetical protein
MPDAIAVDIAKQLTTLLTATLAPYSVVPERSYADFDLELDDDEIHVDVVVVSTKQTVELGSRGKNRYEVPIDVALRKKFGESDKDPTTGRTIIDKIDEMMLLAQTLSEALIPEELGGLGSLWQSSELISLPLLKHIRELRQFTSIVRVTFVAFNDVHPQS